MSSKVILARGKNPEFDFARQIASTTKEEQNWNNETFMMSQVSV